MRQICVAFSEYINFNALHLYKVHYCYEFDFVNPCFSRQKYISIFISDFFLQNPENKLKVSEIYLEHYKTIMYDFMTDDQELDVSIANLSVQIFTVPSVAHHLIEKQDCLTKMIEFFTQIFEDEAKYGIVHLMFSRILNLQKKITRFSLFCFSTR